MPGWAAIRGRLGLALRIALLGWCLGGPVAAQDGVPPSDLPQGSVILVLDQERLFAESQFGRERLERQRQAAEALDTENSRIEAELVAEEQALTDRRPDLPAEEFSALAQAFDAKVERIRQEQDAKVRSLVEARDADRRIFLTELVLPVLGEILETTGAAAILNKDDVVVAANAIDVTEAAVARVDRRWSDERKGGASQP
jgi:Skp family chaperone for outer membrane proteins